MGTVYAGHHPVIGKKVAVKVLAPQCAAVPDLVRRFVEEARAVNKIGHPNIIDIFSFGTLPDARPFFVMEFLEGASLGQRLEAGDLQPDETRRILRQICSALEAAHRAGIVHRDLKPENVWVAAPGHEDSYAKVLDFGIAKLLDPQTGQRTQTGAAIGTPRYMAPEQCMGRDVGPRADLYSLGVILYEMFAGLPPFRGESFGELIYQHMSETPEPPSKHRPIGPELEKVILACLEKDPQRRPESARELGARLDQALAGAPVGTTGLLATAPAPEATARAAAGPGPATTMGQSVGEVMPPPRSRRAGPALAAGGVALALVVGVAILVRGRTTPAPPVEPAPAGAAPAPVHAAAPSPPATGRLRLHLDNGPADRILLDGREVGHATSDVEVGGLAVGPHQVTIEAPDRAPLSASVVIAGGVPADLTLALVPPQHAAGGARRVRPGASRAEAAAAATDDNKPRSRPSRAEEHGLMDSNPFRAPSHAP
jgi:hypothetical protein